MLLSLPATANPVRPSDPGSFTLDIAVLRRLGAVSPDALPDLMVHTDWTTAPMPDARGRIHCGMGALLEIKRRLPVRLVGRIGPTTSLFRFALAPHHLAGGLADGPLAPSPAHALHLLRSSLGRTPDPDDEVV